MGSYANAPRSHRPEETRTAARHSRKRWVDDAVGNGIRPNPSQKLRPDVFQHKIRVSKNVCHNGGLIGCLGRAVRYGQLGANEDHDGIGKVYIATTVVNSDAKIVGAYISLE